MKWLLPAKTFFLGEYAALFGASALILTTTPCFEMTVTQQTGLVNIHPDSPAARLWAKHGSSNNGLHWHDPYFGRGGLGASSAQYLGAYFASTPKEQQSSKDMLNKYFESAWQGTGMRPSGYDVLAQSSQECVYIHPNAAQIDSYTWPFADLAFILLHTGQKLATHQHLQKLTVSSQMTQLTTLVDSAQIAFESADSLRIIDAVNAYHACLLQMNLVAPHSLHQIDQLKSNDAVLAIKGCGAMGSDVLLMLLPANKLADQSADLLKNKFTILATSNDLFKKGA
jgi:mevalonate kinase